MISITQRMPMLPNVTLSVKFTTLHFQMGFTVRVTYFEFYDCPFPVFRLGDNISFKQQKAGPSQSPAAGTICLWHRGFEKCLNRVNSERNSREEEKRGTKSLGRRARLSRRNSTQGNDRTMQALLRRGSPAGACLHHVFAWHVQNRPLENHPEKGTIPASIVWPNFITHLSTAQSPVLFLQSHARYTCVPRPSQQNTRSWTLACQTACC